MSLKPTSSICPVCYQMRTAGMDFFAKWQHRLATDEEAQYEYASESGFCPTHTWQLASMSSPRGFSRGHIKLLKRFSHKLRELANSPMGSLNGLSDILKYQRDCRVCCLMQDVEDATIQNLTGLLKEGESTHANLYAGKVCLRHLSMLIEAMRGDDVSIQAILSKTAERFDEIANNMASYVIELDKLKNRCLTKDQQYAYLDALNIVAGAKYLSTIL